MGVRWAHHSDRIGAALSSRKDARCIGGGFNAYYTAKVCDAAYFLYRERFLARKYGPEIIEASAHAGPDVDLGAGYDEG